MSRFKPYPAYKDSGVEWLGEVPDNWHIYRSKHVFSERNVKASEADEQLTASQKYGVIPQKLFSELEDQKVMQVVLGRDILKKAEVNDFVISMRSFQGGLEFSSYSGAVSSAYVPLFASRALDTRFFKHLFKSKPFISALQNTSNLVRDGQALRYNNFVQLSLPFPMLDEQRTIGAFLDHETARIDALIEEQQRLIELLKEKRQAVISRAVTQGLDPTVPMKDSGLEWLGKVPAHWTVCALRRVIRSTEQGWSPECESYPANENGWGVLKAGCVNRGVFDPSENKTLPLSLEPIAGYEVRAGDILMSRASGSPELVGSTALLGPVREKLMLSDKIFRIHLEEKFNNSFFVWVMNAQFMRSQIEQALSGGNGLANNLPQSSLLSFWLAVPPDNEQCAIAELVDEQVGIVDSLIAEGEVAIKFLQERRSALISAAVTGKIDVRGWQPPAGTQAPVPELEEAV